MSDEERTLAGLASIGAGPMPGAIGKAVARRRVARRLRAGGGVAGCLAAACALVAWSVLPQRPPMEPPIDPPIGPGLPLVEGADGPPSGVRFARGSILALRMAGLDGAWPAEAPTREVGGRGDVTLFGLRQRELAGAGPPAS
jgi:hypothetical protein